MHLVPARSGRSLALGLLTALLLALLLGCGGSMTPPDEPPAAAAECRESWRAIGSSFYGMDRDERPSSLPARWTSILAAVEYHANTADGEACDAAIAKQQTELESLRSLNDELREYDIVHRFEQLRTIADLYLNDPLPEVATGKRGKPVVERPTKADVRAAIEFLDAYAGTANDDLAAGWNQAAAIDLADRDQRRAVVKDVRSLSRLSDLWQQCLIALEILEDAQAARAAAA